MHKSLRHVQNGEQEIRRHYSPSVFTMSVSRRSVLVILFLGCIHIGDAFECLAPDGKPVDW